MPSSRRSFCFFLALMSAAGVTAHADWRTNAGYDVLSAELGAALPTGADIAVLHCEAPYVSPTTYLPQGSTVTPFAGAGGFTGKTFHALGGFGAASDHARVVGFTFYGPNGVANGVTTIHAHEANAFFTELTSPGGPPSWDGTVQNYSWTGTTDVESDATNALRRFDFALNRDGVVAVVALNNNTGAVPQLMSSSYNAICVGLLNGVHSRNGTVVDGVGRMKPDLVVLEGQTSYAAPAVASAATLLYSAIRPGFPAADHPQAVKAILLAGSSKANLPAWQRDASVEPYDDVHGAGELNILNAYHILAQGRQPFSSSSNLAPLGWDFSASSTATARQYFFTVPSGRMANTFSAALTWHRRVTNVVFTSSLPNFTLKLFASSAFTPGAVPIDQSNSGVDNVEHLFQRNLPPGQYLLEISSDTNNYNYALAWEAQIGSGPVMAPRRDAGGNVFIDITGLDPFVTYTVEKSETLVPGAWSSAGTFRTADVAASTSHTWPDPVTPYPATLFYRLRWNAVR